jgi:hypothetical protein
VAQAMTHSAHIRVKARNADGYVCGETHHRAKAPDWLVSLARDIADERGFGARRVTWELRHDARVLEAGIDVRVKCVEKWLLFSTRTYVRPSPLPP